MDSPDSSYYWFHCGRCGSLFRSHAGRDGNRLCSECGMDPSHDQWQVKVTAAVLPPRREKQAEEPQTAPHPRAHRVRKKNTIVFVFLSWLGFMVFLVFVANHFRDKSNGSSRKKQEMEMAKQLSAADRQLLEVNVPRVTQAMAGYVVSVSNEQRSQFIVDPIRVSPKIDDYFSKNPLIRIDMDRLKTDGMSVLHLPEGEAIEVMWQHKDERYETLFFRRKDEWRLDWEHFVRYSEEPFSLFLAGSGPAEAEFRLLARERLAKERESEPEISLTLYAPVPGKPKDFTVESPEFLIPRHEPKGRRLAHAFAMKQRGENPFGSLIRNEDPDDMIRVRVRVRRYEENGKKKFEIMDVIACHWLGVTQNPGVPDDEEGWLNQDEAGEPTE